MPLAIWTVTQMEGEMDQGNRKADENLGQSLQALREFFWRWDFKLVLYRGEVWTLKEISYAAICIFYIDANSLDT